MSIELRKKKRKQENNIWKIPSTIFSANPLRNDKGVCSVDDIFSFIKLIIGVKNSNEAKAYVILEALYMHDGVYHAKLIVKSGSSNAIACISASYEAYRCFIFFSMS